MNIAIVTPNKSIYSETFIIAHTELLEGNKYVLHGGYFPKYFGQEDIPLEKFLPEQKTGFFLKLLKLLPHFFYIRLKKYYFPDKHYSHTEILSNFLKVKRIDVVLAEYGPTGCEVLESCRLSNIPLVVHFHGYDASVKSLIQDYETKYLELFQYAGKIIAVSEVMRSKLISLGCPSEKIIKSTYGPNDRFPEIVPHFSEPKSFAAIGRFVNKKAPYYTVLAIKKVAEKHPDVLLYYAGEGELLETVQNLVKYYKLENNIKLLGVITPEVFISLLQKVTGLIQHSITSVNGDMEGTPVAVLEASGAGIPVIATRHAGIPDVIIDGETGLLSEEHDVDAMAENITKIIENPEVAKKLGQKGKENISANFSMKNHLDIINRALKESFTSFGSHN